MLKNVAKFANHKNESLWETLAQRRTIARMCILQCTLENGHELLGTGYKDRANLSREVHDRKISCRKQRTDIGEYPL